jgi:hypothetical protein
LAFRALQVSLVYLAPRVLQGLRAPQAHLALSALQGQAPQGQPEFLVRQEWWALPAPRVSLEQQALVQPVQLVLALLA